MNDVCEREPPHLRKMANQLWSATLHAILCHGANVLHEVAAFGLTPCVLEHVLREWREADRGGALAETLASFTRCQLACVRLCGLALPVTSARQLSHLVELELRSASAFKQPAALLSTAELSEERWRARSLLQLIADVLALHRPPPSAAAASAAASAAGVAAAGATGAGASKRQRTSASVPLSTLLLEAVHAPGSPEEYGRWLLLIGCLAERHPGALAPSVRTALVEALTAALPAADGSVGGGWGRLPLLAWALAGLALLEPPGASAPRWASLWRSLHALVALYEPGTRSVAGSGEGGAGGASGGAGGGGGSAAGGAGGGGGGGAAGSTERLCFVDLGARCLRVVLERGLLPPSEAAAQAAAVLHSSPLFAPLAERSAGGATAAAAEGRAYLRSMVELSAVLVSAAERGVRPVDEGAAAGGGGGSGGGAAFDRRRLVRWLTERMYWAPVQPAFEATSPWRCALQLRAARAARAAGAEHFLLRRVWCAVVTGHGGGGTAVGGTLLGMPAGSPGACALPVSWLERPYSSGSEGYDPLLGAASDASWRPSDQAAGVAAAPPCPPRLLRRLVPPATAAGGGPVGAVDEGGEEDEGEWDEGGGGSIEGVPMGLLQLEAFLRHVEALSSNPTLAAAAGCAADGGGGGGGGGGGIVLEALGANASSASLLGVATYEEELAAGRVNGPLSHAPDEGADESATMPEITLGLLKEASKRLVAAAPSEAASPADPGALRTITHGLRLVEFAAALMLATGPRRAPEGCLKLLQKLLRKVASWLRRTLPHAGPEASRAEMLAKVKGWARASRTLLALRSCLAVFAALAADARGGMQRGWHAVVASSWPEPLYVAMASEPQTLVHGVKLLCIARQAQQAARAEAAAAGGGGGGIGGGGIGGIGGTAAVAEAMDVDEFELQVPSEAAHASATASGFATSILREEGGATSAAEEAEVGAALHAILSCLDLWALGFGSVGERVLVALPGALEGLSAAALRTKLLALRTLATCMRATPTLTQARRAWPTAVSPPNPATAPAVEGLLGDIDVGGSTVRNLPAPVAALLEPWRMVADSALFGDVSRRLSHAKKHAAKLELPQPECREQKAGVEAKIAAAAASCDGALRRALAVLCRFARAAPATLPAGGSACELRAYNKLWTVSLGVTRERGDFRTIVRDRKLMLPLTPAARLALVEALHAHVEMMERLHASAKAAAMERLHASASAASSRRPSESTPLLLDGQTVDDVGENYEEDLFFALEDTQWAVRQWVVRALGVLAPTFEPEDHRTFLLPKALGPLFGVPESAQAEASFGVPCFAFVGLKRGGGANGLLASPWLAHGLAGAGGGGGGVLGRVPTSAHVPSPYVSPAFEVRLTALHALAALGACSASCTDQSLLLLLLAHGPDPARAAAAAAAAPAGNEPPPPRAALRLAADAALRSLGAAIGLTPWRMLRQRGQQLLALWLQLKLPLQRLPCTLFKATPAHGTAAALASSAAAANAPSSSGTSVAAEVDESADRALAAFVASSRIPLATAAAMASNGEVLTTAARALGLTGGAPDLLLEALPQVLARLLPMKNGTADERQTYTFSLDFVCSILAPQPLHACAQPQMSALLSSIVLCASAERPPSPPQRTVAEIMEVLIAPPDPRAAVSRRPLVESLRSLPPVAMHALVLTVRGAIAAGEASLGALEVLLSEALLSPQQLGAGCTPHLLQAGLLAPAHAALARTTLARRVPPTAAAAGSSAAADPTDAVAASGNAKVDELSHACELLSRLHARLGALASVRAALLPALLRALVPLAALSAAAQATLGEVLQHDVFAAAAAQDQGPGLGVREGACGSLGGSLEASWADPIGSSDRLHAALAKLPPYELVTSASTRGLQELQARLLVARARAADEASSERPSAAAQLLACEAGAPAHALGGYPAVRLQTARPAAEAAAAGGGEAVAGAAAGMVLSGVSERGAPRSELEARAAVTKAILILGSPDALECPTLSAWLEGGVEVADEGDGALDLRALRAGSARAAAAAMRAEAARAAAALDDESALHDGGEAWCPWNDRAPLQVGPAGGGHGSQLRLQSLKRARRSPLERTRCWLLRLASVPALSSALRELISQALSLCATLPPPRALLEPLSSGVPLPPSELTDCADEEEARGAARAAADAAGAADGEGEEAAGHARLLRQLHAVLISPDAPPRLCALAAQSLCRAFESDAARPAALRALEQLHRQPAAAAAYHHLLPYAALEQLRASLASSGAADGTVGGGEGGGGGASDATMDVDAAAWFEAPPPIACALVWAMGSAVETPAYDHAAWLCAVVSPLLAASTDPLLAACTPLAAAAPRFAASMLEAAVQDVARQPAHAHSLASGMHAALDPPGLGAMAGASACPPAKAAALLRVITSLLRNSIHAPAAPTAPTAASAALDAFCRLLCLGRLAEVAADHLMDATALLLLEASKATATATSPSHAIPPAAATPSAAHEARALAVLRRVLPRLAMPDMALGLPAMATEAALSAGARGGVGGVGGVGVLVGARGPWLVPSLELSLADVGLRATHGAQHEQLPAALNSLHRLGCYALVRAVSSARMPIAPPALREAPAPQRAGWGVGELHSVAEGQAEMAWRLGEWTDVRVSTGAGAVFDDEEMWESALPGLVGGGGGGVRAGKGGACHGALASALRLLGRREAGSFAALKRSVGGAQQSLMAQMVSLPPEASGALEGALRQLRLCGTLREGAGGLASEVSITDGMSTPWLLPFAVVAAARQALGGGTPTQGMADTLDSMATVESAGGYSGYGGGFGSVSERAARDKWLQWRRKRLSQQLAVLPRGAPLGDYEPLVALHVAMLRHMQPHVSRAEQLELLVSAGQRARADGHHAGALALLRRAAELASAIGGSGGAAAVGAPLASHASYASSSQQLESEGEGSVLGATTQSALRWLPATWAGRWEHALLLWDAGSDGRTDALLVAKRLRDELQAAMDSAAGVGGLSSAPMASGAAAAGGTGGRPLSSRHATLHVQLLATLGGWMDALRCEGLGAVQKELDTAVYLCDELGVPDENGAVADALLGLGSFHERQFGALQRQADSSTFAKLVSVHARTKVELRRVRNELLTLTDTASKVIAHRRNKLENHARELRFALDALEKDSLATVGRRSEHLLGAMENYLLCLRRAPEGSSASRAAATAVCRLWMRNREVQPLSEKVLAFFGALGQGAVPALSRPFLPLAFQLSARLSTVADAADSIDPLSCQESFSQPSQAYDLLDEGSYAAPSTASDEGVAEAEKPNDVRAAAAFQRALRTMLLQLSEHDPDRAIIHQLIVAAEPAGAVVAAQVHTQVHTQRAVGAATGTHDVGASQQAAAALLQKLRERRPAEVEASIALVGALRRLACCEARAGGCGDETPASPRASYVAIADALGAVGAVAGGGSAPDLSRLHDHLDMRRVPLRVPLTPAGSEGGEPALMVRYLPHFIPVASGRPHACTGGDGPAAPSWARAKLVWCEDEAGVRHAQLLRARPAGSLDPRRDALGWQVFEELSRRLEADPAACARALRLRAPRVLPLAPSAGLYEWRSHCRSMHAYLADEHARAYAEGRDRMRLVECEAAMRDARAADALNAAAADDDDAYALPALGRRPSAIGATGCEGAGADGGGAEAGPAVLDAWTRVTAALTPQLHRFLLGSSPSAGVWLARRAALTRSAAGASVGGWLLGLGERAPHRMLLDSATSELVHVHMQPLLLQRAACDGADCGAAQGGGGVSEGARAPPLMPFRLTRELVDAFGLGGVEGPFRASADATLRLAQGEACTAAILTLLEAFVDEPMRGWTSASEGAAVPWAHDVAAARAARLDAEVAVLHAQRRLSGKQGAAAPLSVESRVRQLISLATKEEALAAQPLGWQPWL